MTPAGFIGLQVHSIPDDSAMAGLKDCWKNIRVITTDVVQYRTPIELAVINTDNRLTKQETDQGWKLLFDGKSTTGWRRAYHDSFPDHGWQVKDGVLKVLASEGADNNQASAIGLEYQFLDDENHPDARLGNHEGSRTLAS
jgi:hypothetical protein